MRLHNQATVLSTFVLTTSFANAVTLNCDHIRVDKVDFNIKPLQGPHSVYQIETTGTGVTRNRTFTFDLCKPLHHSKRAEGCENGARVCAFDRLYEKEPSEETDPDDAWTIAGSFPTTSGRDLDPTMTRLKTEANGEKDTDQEGLRIELRGGVRPSEDRRPQKFIIDLMCDPDRTGLEDEQEKVKSKRERHMQLHEKRNDDKNDEDDDNGGDNDDEDKKPIGSDPDRALQFVSYKATPGKGKESSKVFDVLQLRWHTKYGCEDQAKRGEEESGSGNHWGFFTWFIIIVFLLVASYLIFGSWLNYNRHGARGWDLLPHGDAIRDIPYMLRDWGRRVLGTVSGGGSSGYIRV